MRDYVGARALTQQESLFADLFIGAIEPATATIPGDVVLVAQEPRWTLLGRRDGRWLLWHLDSRCSRN